MQRYAIFGLVLLTFGSDSIASAQPLDESRPLWWRPAVSISAGTEGFMAPELRDFVSDGAAWSARISAGGRSEVRLEVSYRGSVQAVTPTEGTRLVGTSVIGTLRVNVAPWTSDLLEPFVYLGGGWSHFHLRGRRPEAMLLERDDILVLPFGCGFARSFGRLILDARAGVTVASGADLLPTMRDPSSSRHSAFMHGFDLSVGVGFEL